MLRAGLDWIASVKAEWWTAAATAVIALFTATLWRATSKQAKLTRAAIELGNKEFIATHRPKLSVRHVVMTHAVPPSHMPLAIIAEGQPIVGHLNIVNVGGTTAKIAESDCIVHWTTRGELPMTSPYEGRAGNNFAGQVSLDAGQSYRANFRSDATMSADAPTYLRLAPDHHIYVMGWIRYSDGAGLSRQTNFCRRYHVLEGERDARFHIVNDPDYERED